jgi:hypothetical protein
MATLGSREYPEYSFSQCLRYIDEAKKQKITTLAAFLPILGHKNPSSGGVGLKLSSMGKFYRVLEKEGRSIKFTPLGEKIVFNLGGRDRERACFDAISGVSLLKDLYGRLGADFNPQDFAPVLQELTGAKPADLEQKAGDIERLYRDAAQYLRTPGGGAGSAAYEHPGVKPPHPTEDQDVEKDRRSGHRAHREGPALAEGDDPSNYHEYTSGGTFVRVAKDARVLRGVQWMVKGWLREASGSRPRKPRKKKGSLPQAGGQSQVRNG